MTSSQEDKVVADLMEKYLVGRVQPVRDQLELAIREAISLTRKETLEYAAKIVKANMDELAAYKNQAGNSETGRALQKGVWSLFSAEQKILGMADSPSSFSLDAGKEK